MLQIGTGLCKIIFETFSVWVIRSANKGSRDHSSGIFGQLFKGLGFTTATGCTPLPTLSLPSNGGRREIRFYKGNRRPQPISNGKFEFPLLAKVKQILIAFYSYFLLFSFS